jgi:hypothetical protein
MAESATQESIESVDTPRHTDAVGRDSVIVAERDFDQTDTDEVDAASLAINPNHNQTVVVVENGPAVSAHRFRTVVKVPGGIELFAKEYDGQPATRCGLLPHSEAVMQFLRDHTDHDQLGYTVHPQSEGGN